MNLEDNYGLKNVENLLEKYKHFQDKSIFKFSQVIDNYAEHSKFCMENKVNTGFAGMDNIIKGIQPGEVCYIVSPTDVGKTSLSMNIIRANLNKETIIPFFSLENNEYQMFERMVQIETKRPFWETQKLFIDKNIPFIEQCKELTLKWDSCINIVRRVSLDEIIPYLKVCEELTGKKIKFVVIDYIQLVKHLISNEYTKISDIAQTIKEVALILKLPVIVLSQTSRLNAKEGLDLYSAKGSGEIENSAQIYFTLEPLKELPLTMTDDILLKLIAGAETSNIRPLIMKPHKLKRAKKTNVIILLEKDSLRMAEYDKSPDLPFPEVPIIQEEILTQEETPF